MANRWVKIKTVTDFLILGSKITADSDSAMKLSVPAPWKNSRLKGRDNTLLTEVHTVKTMVLPVVMYECENWTIKKAEHERIDAFELWC